MRLLIFVLVIFVLALFLQEIEAQKKCKHLKGKQRKECIKEPRSPDKAICEDLTGKHKKECMKALRSPDKAMCKLFKGKQKKECMKELHSSEKERCINLKGKARGKCMKHGPDTDETHVPENGHVEGTSASPKSAIYEPLGHSYIRLDGNTTFYNAGLVRVYRNNSWGYVCDDNWDIKDANVACKQLGFSRGAETALGNSKYGLAESSDFQMDNVKCIGDETALQYCSYDTEHDCSENEAAGVICKTNLGCKPSWIAGPNGCYRLFIGNAQRINAKEMCHTKDSHLVVIDSLEENKFLSVLLHTNKDNHDWLTDGFKFGKKWAWRSQRKTISTSYWFPGWVPLGSSAQPNKRGKCLSLSNMFDFNGSLYMVNYFFWKTSNCNTVKGFVCEQEKTLNFTEDCYNGNGITYRGYVSETIRGTSCLKWTENRKYNPYNSPNAGLGNHNYCRNPDKDKYPWCWVGPAYKNEFGYCKIKQCKNGTESTTVETTVTRLVTTPKPTTVKLTTPRPTTSTSVTTNSYPTCSVIQMHCEASNVCIPINWRCDGEADCLKGDDEKNCDAARTCSSDKMLCSSTGNCIPNTWKCDGDRDCTDGEDEKDCNEATSSCNTQEMLCSSTRTCIPNTWKCDGDRDCIDGEDEKYCDEDGTCSSDKIQCSSTGTCIPKSWKCDGERDCTDGEDEKDCNTIATTVSVTTVPSINCPIDKMYCQANQTCISLSWKCDGENDCTDGEDEKDCSYKLNQFMKQEKNFIIDALPMEVYVRIPLETCARTCLQHRKFVCKAFHYRESDKRCKLYNTDKSLSIISLSSGYYYVFSGNCSATDFQCKNGKCIPNEKKCNGKDDCNDFSDEQVCGIPEQIEIRLADGQEQTGRVEIKYHNEWGVICDDKWGIKDADVVCRMLGYKSALKAVPFSNFGHGNGNFLLTNVECLGNETTLLDCPKDPWRKHNCKEHETAGVICKLDKACPEKHFECANTHCLQIGLLCNTVDDCGDNSDEINCTPSVTLVNGTNPSNGRIQITISNITGSVCDDNFDNKDATVICKQLGYKSGIAKPGGTYGKGQGIIWFDEVNCDGSEDDIESCETNPWGDNDCDHTEDAGVQCLRDIVMTTTSPTTMVVESTSTKASVCGTIPRLIRTKRADREVEEVFYSKIINGVDAVYGRYPWQVSVQRITGAYSDSYITASHFCGATIVDKEWIMSAAHCFDGKKKESLIIKVGDHNNKVWDSYEQAFKIAELITHPKYDDTTYDYDIALIKVEPNKNGNGIIFNDYVQPACLPEHNATIKVGERCHISGWGNTGKAYPSILKVAMVPIIGRSVCRSLYKNSITGRMICAGYLEGGIDTCQGDSGGPLVCNRNGVYVLTGVTSWGNGCAQPRNPGVYCNVQELKPWIDYIINKYS